MMSNDSFIPQQHPAGLVDSHLNLEREHDTGGGEGPPTPQGMASGAPQQYPSSSSSHHPHQPQAPLQPPPSYEERDPSSVFAAANPTMALIPPPRNAGLQYGAQTVAPGGGRGPKSVAEMELEAELEELKGKLQAANHLLHHNESVITKYEDIVASAIAPQPLVVDNSSCTSEDFSTMRTKVAASIAYGVGAAPPGLSAEGQLADEGSSAGQDSSSFCPPVPYLLVNQFEAQLRQLDRVYKEEEEVFLSAVDTLMLEAGRLMQVLRAVSTTAAEDVEERKKVQFQGLRKGEGMHMAEDIYTSEGDTSQSEDGGSPKAGRKGSKPNLGRRKTSGRVSEGETSSGEITGPEGEMGKRRPSGKKKKVGGKASATTSGEESDAARRRRRKSSTAAAPKKAPSKVPSKKSMRRPR